MKKNRHGRCFKQTQQYNKDKTVHMEINCLMETSISEFNKKLYIPYIQKLEFHLSHVHILGNYHCGKERCE